MKKILKKLRAYQKRQQKTSWLRGVLNDLAGVTRKRNLRLLRNILTQQLSLVIPQKQPLLLKLWTRRVTIPQKRSLNFHLLTMSRARATFTSLITNAYRNRNKNQIALILMGLFIITLLLGSISLTTRLIKEKQQDIAANPQFKRQLFGAYDYSVTSSNGQLTTSLGTDNNNIEMKVERGKSQVKFAIPLTQPKVKKEDQSLVYETENKLISVRYQTLPAGIKEEIILDADPQTNKFTSTISLSKTEPRVTPDGQIVFVDQNNDYQFHILPPFAEDAAGDVTYALKYNLVEKDQTTTTHADTYISTTSDPITGSTNLSQQLLGPISKAQEGLSLAKEYQLILEVDPTWMNDPARVYPIMIDPTVVHDESSEFALGELNRVTDTGSGVAPVLETYYQELAADEHTVGLWHMNESSGTSVADSSGNSNTGTATGTTVVDAKINKGRNYDGIDDYITFGDIDFMDTPSIFTVESWFNRTSDVNDATNHLTENVIIGQSASATNDNLEIGSDGTEIDLYIDSVDSDTFVSFEAGITNNTWYHIALVYDSNSANEVKVYLDGELKYESSTWGGTLDDSDASPLSLGIARPADGNWGDFDGKLDEVRISNIARTPEEIKAAASRRPSAVYTSDVIDLTHDIVSWNDISWDELGVATGDGETLYSATNLVAQWNFNETSGTTADNAEGTAALDGTLSGFDSTASQDADPDSSWTANNKRWGAGALQFDGVDSYVNAGNDSSLQISGAITVEAWINTSASATYRGIIGKMGSSGGGNHGYLLRESGNGYAEFGVSSTGSNYQNVIGKTLINDGNWHHIVGTYTPSTSLKIYVDGILQNTNSTSIISSIYNTSSDLSIGSSYSTPSEFFSGTIDSTRIYSRALPAHEILSNYNSSNIQFQTRVGSTTDPDDGSWDSWSSVSGETTIDDFDDQYLYNTTDTGLVSYWPMNEIYTGSCSGGGDACDVKNTNHGTATGTDIVDGIHGKGRGFDGSSDYITIANESNFDFERTDTFSIEASIKLPSLTQGIIVSKRQSSSPYTGYELRTETDGTISFVISNTSGSNYIHVQTDNSVSTNQWHQIVVTYDGSSSASGVTIYIDGQVWNTTTNSDTLSATILNSINLNIGSRNSTILFDGSIDEVRIYNTALSASTIQEHFLISSTNPDSLHPNISDSPIHIQGSRSEKIETGRPQVDSNTVALWHLDETDGTGAYLKDTSKNTNDADPVGATLTDGISSKSRSFDGVNDYITAANSSDFEFGSSDFSVQWWSYLTTDNTHSEIARDCTTAYAPFLLGYSSSSITDTRVYLTSNGSSWDIASGKTLGTKEFNKWNHYSITRSGSTFTAYKNGVQTDSWTSSASIFPNSNSLCMGRRSDTQYFGGKLDEVRISDIARSAEEISESYRMGRDHYINKTIPSTDLSGKDSLPFYIAADRPGTYLDMTIGESAYANYQPDANTVGLWHMDEGLTGNTSIIKFESTNVAAANAYSYWKAIDGQGTTLATNDTIEYDIYLTTALSNIGVFDARFTDATVLRSYVSCHSGDYSSLAYLKWYHITCTIPSGANGKTIDWIDLVNENDTATAITAYYDNFIVKDSTGATKTTLYTNGSTTYNVLNFESNASNTQTLTTTNYSTDGVSAVDQPISEFIKDNSGNTNDGTPYNTQQTQGKIGKARSFDAGSDLITIPHSSDLEPANLTLEAWIYVDSSITPESYGVIIEKPNSSHVSPYYDYHLRIDNIDSLSNLNFTNVIGAYSGDVITVADVIPADQWVHVSGTFDGTNMKAYVNGQLVSTLSNPGSITYHSQDLYIGSFKNLTSGNFPGFIDEVRISDTARTASEIRQAYEIGLRTHPITIDFAANLDDDINSSIVTNFTIDATAYGLDQPGSGIYPGDKIILKEKFGSTTYYAQATVETVNESTGDITIDSWDSGSTFSMDGFFQRGYQNDKTTVFKWQREYWPIANNTISTHMDAITNLTLRLTNGSEGRTIWLDDLNSTSGYLTTPAGSTITSATGNRYFQYRAILTSVDENVSASFDTVTLDFVNNSKPNTPTLDSPTDTATNVSTKPTLKTTATDTQSDYLRYKIQICTDVSMTTSCQTFDQTSSQTGWSDQDSQTDTAYTSGTQGVYTLQTSLNFGTTYYWRSYAIDPGGTNTWSDTQGTPYSFSTPISQSSLCVAEVAADDSSITLTWSDTSSTENGYEVQRSVNSGAYSTLQDLAANSTSHVDSTISQGNTYQYRIAAYHTGPTYSEWCYIPPSQVLSVQSGLFQFEGLLMEGLKLD